MESSKSSRFPGEKGFSKTVGPYCLFGSLLGLLCIITASSTGDEPLSSLGPKLLEHFGMGLVVASLAVLVYEWVPHWKRPQRLGEQLEAIRIGVERNAVKDVLNAYLERVNGGQELAAEVNTLLNRLLRLAEGGDWAKDTYWRFLRLVLTSLKENAEELSDAADLHATTARDHQVVLYPPAKRTDGILADLMKSLPPHSSYLVTSDIKSWAHNQLEGFYNANLVAARANHVAIKRIFILDSNAATEENVIVARQILTRHLKDSYGWSTVATKMEVRLLDDKTSRELVCIEHPDAPRHLYTNHFGIFQPPENPQNLGASRCVRVRVYQPNLTELYLAPLSPDSNDARQFESVWKQLTPLKDEAELEAAIDRWISRSNADPTRESTISSNHKSTRGRRVKVPKMQSRARDDNT